MPPTSLRRIIVVAGPNGAGKTTFARMFLPPTCPTFINADLIAGGLSPFDPERAAVRAGRLMLQLIREHAARGDTFAFETTLAGKNYARWIRIWRAAGYSVTLHFLGLATVEQALSRVAQRVREGGHHIPDDIVRRRFTSGRENFDRTYKRLVNEWILYDNGGPQPVVQERGTNL